MYFIFTAWHISSHLVNFSWQRFQAYHFVISPRYPIYSHANIAELTINYMYVLWSESLWSPIIFCLLRSPHVKEGKHKTWRNTMNINQFFKVFFSHVNGFSQICGHKHQFQCITTWRWYLKLFLLFTLSMWRFGVYIYIPSFFM